MPELTDEELAVLKGHEQRAKELEKELSRAKTERQAEVAEDKLQDLRRAIQDDIEKLHAEDRQEREALRVRLDEVDGFIKDAKTRQEELDKKGGGTMVIPPTELGSTPTPGAQEETPAHTGGDSGGNESRGTRIGDAIRRWW